MTIQQGLAITREADTAIKLIEAGLAAVQRLNMANDFSHLPILLLSNGLERLMKVVLCLRQLETEGNCSLHSQLTKGKQGHNLEPLLKAILDECFDCEYLRMPAVRADMDYLANDPLLHNILQILSDFGVDGRYSDLNVILDREESIREPDAAWKKMEMELFKHEDDWMNALTDPPRCREALRRTNQRIVASVEKCVRALLRLFTLGPLGQEGKRQTGIITEFLFLTDEQLGTRQYRPFG